MIQGGKVDISKEELNELEPEELSLPIHLVDHTTPIAEVERLCSLLGQSEVLGFDTETKPVFTKGVEQNQVSLLQLATSDMAVLFRLHLIQGTAETKQLNSLLQQKEVLKVGVGVRDDVATLFKDRELLVLNVLDLRRLSTAAGLEVLSLSKMYALLFGKRLSKGQRVSNWEADELSEAQRHYAALDAVAGLRIYEALKKYETPEMRVADFRSQQKEEAEKKKLLKRRRRAWKRKEDHGSKVS